MLLKACQSAAPCAKKDKKPLALELLKKAEQKGVKVILPVDVVIADKFAADANTKTVSG
jgi:phosphoglycerate kinase